MGRASPVLRSLVLAILVLGIAGTGAELLLVDHTEDAWQWIPLGLLLVSLFVIVWQLLRPRARSVRALQLTMASFVASGLAGLLLHAQAKLEFTEEVHPELSGMALFWESMKTQSPPTLAPGMMIQMGLLGLAYTHRHPALHAGRGEPIAKTGEPE
jgi:cation transport ATPase